MKYNPINFKRIRASAFQECIDIKNDCIPLFISIGRIAYPKNFSLLIDVCNKLKTNYKFKLLIIGDGNERSLIQKKISDYGLNNVLLLGRKNNPYPYLNLADAFISTSIVESYGLAVQEALILEKPVIVVKCPAIVETVDSRFGFLVENNFDSLYNAMEQYIVNKEVRLKHKQNIKDYYKVDELYEQRLSEICDLWN